MGNPGTKIDLKGANMEKQNPRKRTSTTAKNTELKFGPPKILKNAIKLEKLPKSKLIERCAELQSAVEELKVQKTKSDQEVQSLKEKLEDLEKNNNKQTQMSSANTQTYPINDVDYNCGVCIFQTSKEQCLWDHMDNEHDVQKETSDTYIKCEFCVEQFVDNSDLLIHKNAKHENVSKPCKYFEKGICLFSKEICWFSHEINESIKATTDNQITCRICEDKFSTKNEFMNHRKIKHNNRVAMCRENEKCKFDIDCWYNHKNKKSTDNEKENIVNKTSEKLHHLESRKMSVANITEMELN